MVRMSTKTFCKVETKVEAIRSANMAYSSAGVNLTLDAFQNALVSSLREMANPETAGLGGATLQYVAGKGDWKWKTSWLREKRDYSNLRELPLQGPSFCRRCSCTTILGDRHWLDFQNLSFNQPQIVAAALDSNVPLDLPLHALKYGGFFVHVILEKVIGTSV